MIKYVFILMLHLENHLRYWKMAASNWIVKSYPSKIQAVNLLWILRIAGRYAIP